MDAFFTLVRAVGGDGDGINLWGMLGCAVAYAGAVFAAVDGIGDHLLHRKERTDPDAIHALRLKSGSKIAAAAITVVTAGVVLMLDANWIAFALLTIAALAIVLWVYLTYRQAARSERNRA
jgi:hypothetical protein